MKRIKSDEVANQLSNYLDVAKNEPVMVIHDGVEIAVMMSVDEYRHLLALKNERYAFSGATSEDFKKEVDKFMDDHAAVMEGLAK